MTSDSLRPRLPAGLSSATPLPILNPTVISVGVFAACVGVGALMAYDPATGIGVLMALCYAPVVLLNLPLGIVLWVPTTFLTALPGVDTASHAAGFLIAFAWLGTLRNRSEEQHAPIPRRMLVVLALFTVWLTVSMAWSEDAGLSFAAWQPWVACALMFTVLLTIDLDESQIRMLAFSFLVGVTFSVALGLIGGVEAPSAESAIADDGRLRGGLDDPNYLAAGIVPSIAIAAGLLPGVRSVLGRIGLAVASVILVLGLAATQSRGGLIAAVVATAAALVVAKRGRAAVVAGIAIVVGLVAVWFAASPDAWDRVTSTADNGNGRGSLWKVGGRVFSDHPVIGVGLDNYRVYAPRYVSGPGQLTFVNFIAERPHVVHNVYLQMLVESGLVALALFLVIVLGSLASALRAAQFFEQRQDPVMAALSRGVFVALLAGLAASFFISNGQSFQIWVLLSFGPILLRYTRRGTDTPPPAEEPIPALTRPLPLPAVRV